MFVVSNNSVTLPVEDFHLLSAAFERQGGENCVDEVTFKDEDGDFKMLLGEKRVLLKVTNTAKKQLLPLNGFSVHSFKKSIEDEESAEDDTVTIRSRILNSEFSVDAWF